ncbi:MAG: 5-formyltetrahydrofolate cyclo-ligase [bacterium]
MNTTKSRLRDMVKRSFEFYPREILDSWSEIIQDVILETIRPYKTIMSYVSTPREVSTFKILKEVLKDGKILVVPKVVCNSIVPVRIKSLEELSIGAFKVLEPEDSSFFDISMLEVIIVPGIAFNTNLHRIGHGGGHFDKFLKSLPPYVLKIGLAYDFQVVEEEFEDHWDEKVDIVITEKRRIECTLL